jgi:hypothetical protein
MKIFEVQKKPVIVKAFQANSDMIIKTLEGNMKAKKGDWIIIGLNNERYPVKPDIFDKSYRIIQEIQDLG